MDGEFFEVVEWKIDNFCEWNEDAHVFSISSPGPLQNKTTWFELYPCGRGVEGLGKNWPKSADGHLTVRIINYECADLSGDLSLIASDGSLLSFHLVHTRSSEEFYLGPKLEDIVALNRNNESFHKDCITMQCRFKSAIPCKHVMYSNINVSELSLKLGPQFIENLTTEKSEFIARIKCDIVKVDMLLTAECDEETILFNIESDYELDTWLENCMSVLSSEGTIMKSETKEIFLYEQAPSRILICSLGKEELIEKDTSILFHLKITDAKDIKGYHNQVTCLAKNVSIVPKNNLCFCKEKSSDNQAIFSQADKSVSVLSKDLLCLYQDKEYSDLQLKCEGVSFPVHRNILSARSPVFKRLLSSDMREAASGTVDIKDLAASTLSLLLTHLYTGTVKDLQAESCLNLYYAADKYDVPTLKTECTEFFLANISISNVCDILALADKHQDDLLIISAYAFILKNLQEVTGSEEWKRFVKSEPLLAAETLTHFAQKKYVKSGNTKLSKVCSP